MKLTRLLATTAMAISCVAAEDAVQPGADSATAPIKGGDTYLLRSVAAVGERMAGILRVAGAPALVAVRADETTRSAEALARARAMLSPEIAAARGRAWHDLGLGSGGEPQELIAAIERDLEGVTFDAARGRLLVDPARLRPDVGHADPDEDTDASILLTTGVAPDEPVVGHYLAHVLLDGPSLDGPVTTDAVLARSALAEGSANLAALVFLFGGVGLEAEVVSGVVRPEETLDGRLVPRAMQQASPVVAHLLEFVYLDGFAQVSSIARKGGFARLAQDRKLRRTTRDVLHVDRPPAAPPAEFVEAMPSYAPGLVAVDRDSLGEQGVVTLVSLLTGKDNLGLIAGDGWVADTLWRYEPAPGSSGQPDDGTTVWVTRWNTEDDAKDMAYSLERCLQARFPGSNLADDQQRGGRVLMRPDRVYRIERTGLQVVFRVVPPVLDGKSTPPAKKKAVEGRQSPAKK